MVGAIVLCYMQCQVRRINDGDDCMRTGVEHKMPQATLLQCKQSVDNRPINKDSAINGPNLDITT